MSAVTRVTGHFLRVEPSDGAWTSATRLACGSAEKYLEYLKGRCEEAADQIKRHVDGVSVALEADTEIVCGHCGNGWSNADAAFNGCCALDIADEDAALLNAEAAR